MFQGTFRSHPYSRGKGSFVCSPPPLIFCTATWLDQPLRFGSLGFLGRCPWCASTVVRVFCVWDESAGVIFTAHPKFLSHAQVSPCLFPLPRGNRTKRPSLVLLEDCAALLCSPFRFEKGRVFGLVALAYFSYKTPRLFFGYFFQRRGPLDVIRCYSFSAFAFPRPFPTSWYTFYFLGFFCFGGLRVIVFWSTRASTASKLPLGAFFCKTTWFLSVPAEGPFFFFWGA